MDSEEKQRILHHSFMEDNPLTLSGKDETLINLADKEKSRYPDRVLPPFPDARLRHSARQFSFQSQSDLRGS